jgi:hypothetical protein
VVERRGFGIEGRLSDRIRDEKVSEPWPLSRGTEGSKDQDRTSMAVLHEERGIR